MTADDASSGRAMVTRRPSLTTVCCCVLLLLSSGLECSTRLQTTPIPVCDIIKKVQTILTIIDQSTRYLDCILYTPNDEEFRKCPSCTLRCFALEMKVLMEELDIPQRYNITDKLMKVSKKLQNNQTFSQCPSCELSEESNAKEFLERVLDTLQEIMTTPRRTFNKTCQRFSQ